MDNGEWAMGLHSNYPLSILHFPLNRHDFFILVSKHIFDLFDILIMDFCNLASAFFCSSSASPSFTAFSVRRCHRDERCVHLLWQFRLPLYTV